MKAAESGNTVKVHYIGKLDDGTVFDSSREREPLEFTLGSGQLIGGFEDAVIGMTAGSSKTIKIQSSDAYGDHKSELILKFDRAQVPAEIEPKEGLQLDLKAPDGGVMPAVITAVDEAHITLDANHPLAGKDLTFDIELVEVL